MPRPSLFRISQKPHPNIIVYNLIASPINFNLIWGFRYLQFKPDALHRLYARQPWKYTATLRRGQPEFKWNFIIRKFKEGLKVQKKSLGTPPDSWLPPKGHPRLVDNRLAYVYQFLTSNSNFKTTSNVTNFLFQSILLILWEKLFIAKYTQSIYQPSETAQNVDMWDEPWNP